MIRVMAFVMGQLLLPEQYSATITWVRAACFPPRPHPRTPQKRAGSTKLPTLFVWHAAIPKGSQSRLVAPIGA